MNRQISPTIDLPQLNLELSCTPVLLKDEAGESTNEIVFVASNETIIPRYNWWTGEEYELVLKHTKDSVDLSRVENGVCMFLEDHSDDSDHILGKIKSATVTNKNALETTVKIDTLNDKGKRYYNLVLQDLTPGVSVGANPLEITLLQKAQWEYDENGRKKKQLQKSRFELTRWQLLELSSVAIPAIASASVKNSQNDQTDDGKNIPLRMHSVRVNLSNDASLEDFSVLFSQQKDQEMPFNQNQSDSQNDALSESLRLDLSKAELKIQTLEAEIERLKGENETLRAHIEKSEQDQKCSLRFFQLRKKADQLLAEFKLSKAGYSRYFSENSDRDLSEVLNAKNPTVKLDNIEDYLGEAELNQPLLNSNVGTFQGENLNIQTGSMEDTLEKQRQKAREAYLSLA